MQSGRYRFDRFLLDPGNRQLRRDGTPVELNARYLDALALLVREQGMLVSKDHFMAEVWRGVPVTDEALTQCVRTLRRLLGDDAASPRFIETVPKHGYRFIAPVEQVPDGPSAQAAAPPVRAAGDPRWQQALRLAAAGTAGGGVAGIFGGLFYGLGGASNPVQPGIGAASMLVVLLCVNIVLGLIAGAGVASGIAVARTGSGRLGSWSIVGGAAGGLIVGALVKLIGTDAFSLLLGRSPGDITGAAEGALLGAAAGLGAWVGSRRPSLRRGIAAAAAAGSFVGLLVVWTGGRLMGGSLDLLARHFPQSRLRLDAIGSLLGESGFGPASELATAAVEGAAFCACVVGAMLLALAADGPSARPD